MIQVKSLLLTVLVIASCYSSSPDEGQNIPNQFGTETKQELVLISEEILQKSESGIIVFNEQSLATDSVHILNLDGSIWWKFTFYYKGKFSFPKEFRPLAFHPDYFLLAMEIKSRVNQNEYIVDVGNGLEKKINLEASALKFQNWKYFFQERVFSVFQEDGNLFSLPFGQGEIVGKFKNGIVYKPREVNGDWLKVTWGDEEKSGWVRWRNEKIILELFYFS